MSITRSEFGVTEEGHTVYQYRFTNGAGIEVNIINYGGIITSVKVPDREGKVANIVLGFDNLADYRKPHPYFGALIGRYGNRIANGRFTLYGKEYQLSVNDGKHHLHGGLKGFDKQLWEADIIQNGSRLQLSYYSRDGEEGYPGNVKVNVIYELTENNELHISYEAETDQATPINLTAHSYFNLTGNPENDVLAHKLMLKAQSFAPVGSTLIPTGEIKTVTGTPFNFTTYKSIGADIESTEGGYDHNFVVSLNNSEIPREIAVAYDKNSGRELAVFSTEPGFQFYSGNFLDGSLKSPSGIPFKKHSGFCIEPQHFPDSPNQESFPSTILEPGERYISKTIYRFGIRT